MPLPMRPCQRAASPATTDTAARFEEAFGSAIRREVLALTAGGSSSSGIEAAAAGGREPETSGASEPFVSCDARADDATQEDDVAGIGVPVPPPPPPPQGGNSVDERRPMSLMTVSVALHASERVESVDGPHPMSLGGEVIQFCMSSNIRCKAFLASDEDSHHIKLQAMFEDGYPELEEQRYAIANEWNKTRRYTRLSCGMGGAGRRSGYILEWEFLCPTEMRHYWGLVLLTETIKKWYTSLVACLRFLDKPSDLPSATLEMIAAFTRVVAVGEEDTRLQHEACSICLEGFEVGEFVRRLPCMHTFHVTHGHCDIDKHLVRDKQCPLCKTPIDIMVRLGHGCASTS